MNILLKIAILILKTIYFFMKLLPTKNKIVMISRQTNDIPVNFELLKIEINKTKKFNCIILAKKLEPGILNKIRYIFHMFIQMYHIATSKVIILDSYCIVISLLKHKEKLLIIQMWHAMGALKKFGKSVLTTDTSTSALDKQMSKEEKIELSNIMKMHANYDYIFTSSKYSISNFAEAFGYEESKIVVMPLPIVDRLKNIEYINNISKKIMNEYKELKEKNNIVYVPTFRKNENFSKIQELIDSVDYEKYNLIIKTHPLTKIEYKDNRVIWDKNYSSIDMMIIADYIITDYSAIVFEASLLNKPLYFYTYDLNEYINQRDFYMDYKLEMPGLISKSAEEIIDSIKKEEFDLNKIAIFSKKYINFENESVCTKIIDFIECKLK